MSGMSGTINAAAVQGNLEMVKYCVANKCPIYEDACASAASGRSSRGASNTYAKKPKRLGIWALPFGRLKMVISTYSNILLSVSMINMTNWRVRLAAENGHLDCLKYLRETAKAPWDSWAVTKRTRTTTPNVYNTSSTTTVLSQKVGRTRTESSTCQTIQNQN